MELIEFHSSSDHAAIEWIRTQPNFTCYVDRVVAGHADDNTRRDRQGQYAAAFCTEIWLTFEDCPYIRHGCQLVLSSDSTRDFWKHNMKLNMRSESLLVSSA